MPVVGNSWLTIPMENLKTLIASTTAFQSWAGEVDVAGAKGHIDLYGFDAAGKDAVWANVYLGEDQELPNSTNSIVSRGMLSVGFRERLNASLIDTDSGLLFAAQYPDAAIGFLNNLGAVLKECMDIAATSGHLVVRTITHNGPLEGDPQEHDRAGGAFMFADVVFAYGTN